MSLIILPRLLPPGKRPATAVVVDTIGLRCTLTIILGGSSTALMPDPAPFRASLARVALPFAYVRATSLHTGRRSTNDASTMVCPEFATDDAAHGGSAGPSFWPSSTTKARHHGVSALPAIISHRTDRLVGEEASLAKALGRWRSATGASRGDRQNRNLQHPLALASRRERLGGTSTPEGCV